jgi:hypothetical protein
MANETEEYIFERANSQNIENLSIIFYETKGIDIPLNSIKKKFDTSYTGIDYIGFFAFTQDKKPAAFYGVFPCFLQIENKVVLSAQSGDTITHIDHQRKGLFIKLAKLTYDLAQKEGVKIIFGFPNQNSYHGFVKNLHFHVAGSLQIYRFKSNGLPIYRALHRLKLGRLYQIFSKIRLKKATSTHDGFIGSIPRADINSGFRNAEFYKYKSYNQSSYFELDGIKIWCRIDANLFIGDISCTSEIQIEDVVIKLKKFAASLGLDQIIFEVTKDSYWDQMFSKLWLAEEGAPVIYKNLMNADEFLVLEFTSGDVDVF